MTSSKQELESQIWQAMDQLRGKLSIQEAIEYLIGILFLRILLTHQRNGSNAEGILMSYKWQDLSFAEAPHQVLGEVFSAIEASSGYREFGEILAGFGITTLVANEAQYLQIIDAASKVDIEQFAGNQGGQIADALITSYTEATGKRSGEFHTPPEIGQLMIRILDPRPGHSIYDPSCGTGNFLIAADHYVRDLYPNSNSVFAWGQDTNNTTAALAKMNFFLNGLPPNNIVVGDSLRQPFYPDDIGSGFDIVVTNPPFSLRHNAREVKDLVALRTVEFEYGPVLRNGDFNFIQNALACLNSSGRAAVLTAPRVLFAGATERTIRKSLLDADVIEAVIFLSANLLVHTGIPVVILLLNKNKQSNRRKRVRFIYYPEVHTPASLNQRTIGEEGVDKIVSAVLSDEDQPRFASTKSIEEISSNDFSLVPNRYVGLYEGTIFLGADVKYQRLGSIADISCGVARARRLEGSIETPIVRGRDLSSAGITVDDLDHISLPNNISKAAFTEVGDILVQRMGQTPSVYLVGKDLEGVLISDSVVVIRPLSDYQTLGRYIVELLNSDYGHTLLTDAMVGTQLTTLRPSMLERLKIPISGPVVVDLINQLHDMEQALIQRIKKTRLLSRQVFSIENAEDVDSQLRELTVQAQVLQSISLRMDDFNFQIRNLYPYVLAFSYRTLKAHQNPMVLYREQLRVAENLLAFLANLGLAMAAWSDLLVDNEEALDIAMIQGYWQGGISPGDWQNLGLRTAKILRRDDQFDAIISYARLWFKGRGFKESEFARRLRTLVKLKNDFKHDREDAPAREPEFIVATENLEEHLRYCLKRLNFFVKYPMRLVQSVDINWRSQQAILDTLRYTGDHPGLRQEKCNLDIPLGVGQLYLEISDSAWVPLYPLITALHCTSCHTRETYHIDAWDGRDKIRLKSFERGHNQIGEEATKAIADDIRLWLARAFEAH